MKTLQEIREYLHKEQTIARDPGTPEWQVFTALGRLAEACRSVEQFVSQAKQLPLEGPPEEVKEAQQWLAIALDTIQGQEEQPRT
jgi:hypothetical protein